MSYIYGDQLPVRIGLVGLGNWGTALGNHLAWKGHDVLGWCREADVIESVRTEQRNCRNLSHVQLSANLSATEELSKVMSCEMLLLAVSAKGLSDVVELMAKCGGTIAPTTKIVSAIKGLEPGSRLTPLQFLSSKGFLPDNLAVLSGPSFARDVIARLPCGVVVASKNEDTAKFVAHIFASDSMRLYTSVDPLGVELGGITKNVIAVAAGAADGLGLGESARAGLITRGLSEMTRLAVAMGADERTLAGLSGLGDLSMTATSTISRNHQVGFRLGKGETLDEILRSLGSVAEGVATAEVILDLAQQYAVEMPITLAVSRVVKERIHPREILREIMAKPVKSEV